MLVAYNCARMLWGAPQGRPYTAETEGADTMVSE